LYERCKVLTQMKGCLAMTHKTNIPIMYRNEVSSLGLKLVRPYEADKQITTVNMHFKHLLISHQWSTDTLPGCIRVMNSPPSDYRSRITEILF